MGWDRWGELGGEERVWGGTGRGVVGRRARAFLLPQDCSQRDTVCTNGLAAGSFGTARTFRPVVGSPSPYAIPKLPDNIDFDAKPTAPVEAAE